LFSQASHNSRLAAVAPVPGDASVLARVRALIADLRPDDVDLLKGLHRIQHEFHHVPPASIPLLAEQFATTPAIIYGTIDFYAELHMEPRAEHVVEWCSGPACLVRRSLDLRRALEAELGCRMDEKSADGRFALRLAQCDGSCDLAPQIRYRGRYIGPLTTSEAIGFARELKGPLEEPAPDVRPRSGGETKLVGTLAPGEEAPSGQVVRETAGPRPPLEAGDDPTREPGE
jgi:NADH:ubiquinone oxidoreductase subunit E